MNQKKLGDASAAVYEALKEQILHLELPPGSAISEIQTADTYHVSRTPVRDAFKALVADDLLEIRPHVGTFVSLIDLRTVSDILYLREVTEQAVLQELAAGFERSQAYAVQLALEQQEQLLASGLPAEEMRRAFIIKDNAFHRALFTLAGKESIPLLLERVISPYERFRAFVSLEGRESPSTLYDQHKVIWSCITEHRSGELREVFSHHIYDGFLSSTPSVQNHPQYFKNF